MRVHGEVEEYEQWEPRHGIDDFVVEEFTCGYCYYLALVLHDRTGWRIRGEWDDAVNDLAHLWVVTPAGDSVDIRGVLSGPDAPAVGCGAVRDYSRSEVSVYWMNPEVIEWAERIVAAFPTYFGLPDSASLPKGTHP